MKKPNLFCAAAILSLAVSVPVFAGDVQTPTIVSPPPPPITSNGAPEPSAPDMGSQGIADTSTNLWIDLFLSMLSLY
jgi:hypothetical protein